MEEVGGFQDWELLGVVQSPVSAETSIDFVGMEDDSEGVIRSDYFSLDSGKRYAKKVSESDLCEEGSVDSDNPSWVDPGSEPRNGDDAKIEAGFEGIVLGRKNSGEFRSYSSSERSVSQENCLGCGDDAIDEVAFEEYVESKGIEPKSMDFNAFWSDSGGDGSSLGKVENAEGDSGAVSVGYEQEFEEEGPNGSDSGVMMEVAAEGGEVTEGLGAISRDEGKGEEGKRKIVWWKLPFELLKFCAFRVSPVWSFSIAAAMMGLVILGRRLYKMKRKTRATPLKVTVEDKKVSQFMTRAARLNEAFSVVRRVPIIRPPLPTAGVIPWPVMSLR